MARSRPDGGSCQRNKRRHGGLSWFSKGTDSAKERNLAWHLSGSEAFGRDGETVYANKESEQPESNRRCSIQAGYRAAQNGASVVVTTRGKARSHSACIGRPREGKLKSAMRSPVESSRVMADVEGSLIFCCHQSCRLPACDATRPILPGDSPLLHPGLSQPSLRPFKVAF